MTSPTSTDKIYLGVLHYHLLEGGVRTVICNALKGLTAHGPFSELAIDLISCDASQPAGERLVQELTQWAADHCAAAVTLRPLEIAALAYDASPAANRDDFFGEGAGLCNQILTNLDLARCDQNHPYILHAHNANLGKHPRLTLALKLLADHIQEENLPVRLFYQMHDFAEDQRRPCWDALTHCTGRLDRDLAVEMMYPPSERVHWLCINSADQEKLRSTGLPQRRVTVLPNAVEIDAFTAPSLIDMSLQQRHALGLEPKDFAADLKNRITEFARRQNFVFELDRKLLLSPIKAIRRKNVIESILLLIALNSQNDNYQLMITLGAHSEPDVAYCRAIEEFVKQHRLPVMIGFGVELAGHQRQICAGQVEAYSLIDLMAISHAVVTTSIQEGFGYVFHEPWLAGKAVIGRNIDYVTRDFIANGMQLDHLYDHLLFPRHWLGDHWETLCNHYGDKLASLREAAGLETVPPTQLRNRVEQAKTYQPTGGNEPMVDWADLSIEMQLAILKYVMDDSARTNALMATNNALAKIDHLSADLLGDIIKCNRRVVRKHYSLQTQADLLGGLILDGLTPTSHEHGREVKISNEPIFEQSVAPERLRLLL